MKIQTFTIVAGTAACNAGCPYCISKMTPRQGVSFKEPEVNWRNFDKACRLAQVNNVSTVLFTGKGEPTLYPEQLTKFLEHMKKFDFPLVELQTNGIIFSSHFEKYKRYLKNWYNLGLNTLAISIVHYKKEKNKKVFTPDSEYIDMENVIKKLHSIGFSVRLSCVMLKNYIDSINEVKELARISKRWGVEQLTIRKVGVPSKSENKQAYLWTKKHRLSQKQLNTINGFLEKSAKRLMTLEHGAVVYDLNGQNICSTDCLTIRPKTDSIRQLIFFPEGHLRYDWQYKGAILV